jgi:hypothetical protein
MKPLVVYSKRMFEFTKNNQNLPEREARLRALRVIERALMGHFARINGLDKVDTQWVTQLDGNEVLVIAPGGHKVDGMKEPLDWAYSIMTYELSIVELLLRFIMSSVNAKLKPTPERLAELWRELGAEE